MTPGWNNVRNGLAANGHRRPRLIGHNVLIIGALALAGWALVVAIAWSI
jgi:hypothetical protein